MSQKGKIAIVAVIVLLAGFAVFAFDIPYRDTVDDFATCIAAGNPAMESYPRQCRDQKTGELYIEEVVGTNDLIRIDSPAIASGISSPGKFSGQARGTWFFEASFPIEVRSKNGDVLGQGHAEARGDWMTTDFVPWMATVAFDPKDEIEGIVRFMKDNPSGLPENDAHVDVPVRFVSGSGAAGSGTELAACRPTGCSGQICAEEDMVSTCEYRAEYACYKTAKCERQASGACGWTTTPALTMCLGSARDTNEL